MASRSTSGTRRSSCADGRRLSLVDVPGHERFVRTMVAGATGIDLFLLVIDAGEGARPQTHEHLAILRLLGVEAGVVAVTKADAVDAETLELAVLEAQELVPGVEVVAVSARTGLGLDELRAAIGRAADGVDRAGYRPSYLASTSDRVFTLRGIGTVVTGTLWSGTIGDGDELSLEPGGRAGSGPQRAGARPARGAGRGRTARRAQPARRRSRRGDAWRRARRAEARTRSRTGSTSRSTSCSPCRTTPASPSTTVRAGSRREWPASGSGTHSCA